ncbi:MAG: cupin domain-containing protein [Lachnospiraceae bacterium]|nr:cupin domain-containing protein [Lachnospiraceae bacterium]
MHTEIVKHCEGGIGEVKMEHLLEPMEMHGKIRLYARVTIEPGNSLGYHEHHHESESYFILSGTGVYSDNGMKRTVKSGEITYTPNGFGHGMENVGSEPLVFMALVVLD